MGSSNSLVAGQKNKMKFSVALQTDVYQNLIRNTIQDPDKAKSFVAAISSAVAVNPQLQECNAGSILAGALLGESLNLSPSPQLGQYYLIPFKNQKRDRDGNKMWAEDEKGNKLKDEKGKWIPITESSAQFVCGYKGFLQLALRTGQYKDIDVMTVRQGEYLGKDSEKGKPRFKFIEDDDERESLPVIGYMAYFEYLNGFEKVLYWPKKKMLAHADKYSPAFSAEAYEKYIRGEYDKKDEWKYSSFWYKNFDAMAEKTMLRQLISKWGIMSIEIQRVLVDDEKMTNLVGTDIVTEDIAEMPEAVNAVTVDDMKPDFEAVGGQVNLDDL